MTVFVPMRPDYFRRFTERVINDYAHENVASFRWDEPTSLARARAQFHKLLPQGRDTPGHHLCEILERAGGGTIGDLWFEVMQAPDSHFAYLYDLHIEPGSRERHHGKAALELLESRCRELGAHTLGLHVFAHNATAQALYNSLGFGVTGFNMVKRLDGA